MFVKEIQKICLDKLTFKILLSNQEAFLNKNWGVWSKEILNIHRTPKDVKWNVFKYKVDVQMLCFFLYFYTFFFFLICNGLDGWNSTPADSLQSI